MYGTLRDVHIRGAEALAAFRGFQFHEQLDELNTNFHPDLFWFDGDWEQKAEDWNADGIIRLLRGKNPTVIVNSRIQGYGDYATPDGVPVVQPKDRYWELCYTMNDSWGYQTDDQYSRVRKSCSAPSSTASARVATSFCIFTMADGTIPAPEVAILKVSTGSNTEAVGALSR